MQKHAESDSIRAAMASAFPAADARVVRFYEMQEYHLGWRDADLQPTAADSGKLIRPRLCVLACQVVGGAANHAAPLAAAVQLLHDFSLIHDDIQDHSPTRRGRATVWQMWGVPQAINAGDGMFVASQLALLRLAEAGVNANVVVEIARRFNETVMRICEGQYLDMAFEERLEISEADYLAMISRKTAALIAAATGLGAILGEANQAQAVALYEYGESLGLAFQIEDDLLGIWGKEADTGKPDAHDIWGRKKGMPLVHALHHAADTDAATLRRIYSQPELSAADVQTVVTVLERTGSRGYTAGVARFYHDAALAALDRVQPYTESAMSEIRAITTKLLGRAK